MTRKYLLVVIVMLPLIVFAQKRTIVISHDNYNHDPFHNIFRHLSTPFKFVDRLFHKQANVVNRLHDKLSFTIDIGPGFSHRLPSIINEDDRIILNNNSNIIILPKRDQFMNGNRNGIIIKKNGRSIYIQRDRRS